MGLRVYNDGYANIVEWDPPSDKASDWNKFSIERADTEGGEYSELEEIDSTDSDNKWVTRYYDKTGTTSKYYKVRPYDSANTVYGAYVGPVTATTYTTTYTTAEKVAKYIQYLDVRGGGYTFGGSTDPTIWDVERLIVQAEDEIDRRTGHAWRTRYSGTTTGQDSTQKYIYVNMEPEWSSTEWAVYLPNRKITTFDSESGDELKVWDGNSYTDYLSETSGRANDYFVDYDAGIIRISNPVNPYVAKPAKIKYRYGESTVPYDIEKLVTMMAAKEILLMDERSATTPDEGGQNPQIQRIEKIQAQINKLLQYYAEWK